MPVTINVPENPSVQKHSSHIMFQPQPYDTTPQRETVQPPLQVDLKPSLQLLVNTSECDTEYLSLKHFL